ncbi:MAG: SUMF1/EgtB/PvdO family nonheme iron enzyme [Proteobacteria bacterium]|jgi:formylglycine-generating enzyme required for sulfatase activity/uncharacterized caspase-like protein|nr:SUMF1/EgtB/PvdO family nonheme iron enzyme [Pseudomonadota bacterium]
MLWLLLASALALPDVDSPLKTGLTSSQDAGLVVGVEDYFKLPDVPYAVRDAEAFQKFLVHTRGVLLEHVRLLTDGANREQILAELAELAGMVGTDGVLWVYFAGHGAASPSNGERMLLGADVQTDPASFEARSVRLSELRRVGEVKLVLVLDTCYAGKGRSGQDLLEGQRFAVPAWVRDAGTEGVVQWTAASANELSGPLEPAQHGAFTYFVLGALRGWADGALDGQRDGQVTADEARSYVTTAMLSAQVTDQHPVLQATDARQWVLSRGELEAAPSIDATSWSPAQQDAGYLDVVARRKAEEQRIRNELRSLEAAHGARISNRVREIQKVAAAEWERVKALAEVDATVAAEATSAYLRHWQGHTELVEGEVVEVPVVEVSEASALGAALRSRLYRQEETRKAVWDARVQDLHARVDEAVAAEQELARHDWASIDVNDESSLTAFASRWEGHIVEVEGVAFPVAVVEATIAQTRLQTGAVARPDMWMSTTIGYAFQRLELPQKTLFVGAREVTQRQWVAVMHDDNLQVARNLADKKRIFAELLGGDRPALELNWTQAIAFCNTLSQAEGLKPAYKVKGDGEVLFKDRANGYRLATEEEWAFLVDGAVRGSACRVNLLDAPGQEVYRYHDDEGSFDCDDGWVGPAEVGSYQPDAHGLYDIEGNISEWGWGAKEGADHEGNPSLVHPLFGTSFVSGPDNAASNRVDWHAPVHHSFNTGLRLVRNAD